MLHIVNFNLGPLETNCALLHNGREALLIDAGGDARPVTEYLRDNNLTLTDILITHMHFDHTLGVADLAEASGATVWADARDEYLLTGNAAFGCPDPRPFKYAAIEEKSARFIGADCAVLSTPGHTPGSLSFYFPELAAVFCGDVLFHRSVGRTDLPGGNADTLAGSIRRKLYPLPDATTVYPGHMLATNIGDEKRLNPFVRG